MQYFLMLILPSDCRVLFCNFHREQAWERWTSKKDNGVSHNKETLLRLMRQIARSRTEECFESSLQMLRETPDRKANMISGDGLKICG